MLRMISSECSLTKRRQCPCAFFDDVIVVQVYQLVLKAFLASNFMVVTQPDAICTSRIGTGILEVFHSYSRIAKPNPEYQILFFFFYSGIHLRTLLRKRSFTQKPESQQKALPLIWHWQSTWKNLSHIHNTFSQHWTTTLIQWCM